MGNCWQTLFPSSRSVLKKESLLQQKQLDMMIKPSTQHDSKFYSSPNLLVIEKYLSSLQARTEIDDQFVNSNLAILRGFIKDLKDEASEVKQQLQYDILDSKQLGETKKEAEGRQDQSIEHMLANLVVLRIEVQALVLGKYLAASTLPNSQEDLYLEIEEELCNNSSKASRHDSLKPSFYETRQLIDVLKIRADPEQGRQKMRTSYKDIEEFKNKVEKAEVFSENNQNSPTKFKKHKTHSHQDVETQHVLQQFPIFWFIRKIVHRDSKLVFTLYQVKRSKLEPIPSHQNTTKSMMESYLNRPTNGYKNRAVRGSTTLSVADFIFYTSPIVSDVVTISSPSSIKSSITTNTSSMTNSNPIAFVSLRGQGLRAGSLMEDYVKIIRQHESVATQLQLCLRGERPWEMLSEFKQSSESQPNQSHYSEYSAGLDNNLKYKM